MGRISETFLIMTLMTGIPHGRPTVKGLPSSLVGGATLGTLQIMKST